MLYFLKVYLFIFREGGGREKERERNVNVWLPLECPQLGTWLATQACALTGNQTSNPFVHRSALNPLNHTSQGNVIVFWVSWECKGEPLGARRLMGSCPHPVHCFGCGHGCVNPSFVLRAETGLNIFAELISLNFPTFKNWGSCWFPLEASKKTKHKTKNSPPSVLLSEFPGGAEHCGLAPLKLSQPQPLWSGWWPGIANWRELYL